MRLLLLTATPLLARISMRATYGLIASLLILLCAQSAAAEAPCVKSVGWFEETPYSMPAEDGSVHGVNIELAKEILHRVGCTADFVNLPVARGLLYLQDGKLDMYLGLFENDERDRIAEFSTATGRAPLFLFVADRDNLHITGRRLQDLIGSGLRIGVVAKRSYGANFDKLRGDPQFEKMLSSVNAQDSIWKMIAAAHLDATLSDETTALLELTRLGLSGKAHKTSIVISTEADHVGFSKKTIDAQFIDTFNRTFNAMLSDGSYAKIWNAYMPCEFSARNLGCK